MKKQLMDIYRRRNNGVTIKVHNIDIDNHRVVSYNPWLLHKYGTHVNVKTCMSIKSVKYLICIKDIQGHDRIKLELQERLDHDEISIFLDARYVSSPEAALNFAMYHHVHTIIRLAIHLLDQQNVYFTAGNGDKAFLNAKNVILT